MAESIGVAGGGHQNLNLTTDEKRVYGQLFKEADPDGFDIVSGDVAVKFFEKTKLPADVLGQIWQIADVENRGFLTPAGFGVVLRLIGHAQAGRAPSVAQAAQPGPLPRFEGSLISGPISSQSTGTPSSPSQSGPPIRVPPLGPDKVAEYSALFEKSGAENGMLSGIVAKQIFERAKLPNEVLGRIWSLADIQGRGSLDVTEFVIAMHLLASFKTGSMRAVPQTLPPGLYDAASRRPPPRMGGFARPGSSGGPPTMYGQSPGFNRQQTGTPLSSQTTGDWAVTAADKARFDQIFANLDKQGLGHINGEQAVEFFGNARLPEDTLAQIWDLADINSEGRLDRDEFAVAMYLIRQQRGSKDGRGLLPPTLPPALIPPSKRKQPVQPSQPTAPAFENAMVTQPRSAAEDLFGLDVLAPVQPISTQVAQSTGGTDAGPFGTPRSPVTSPSTLPLSAGPSSTFKPFEPSSTFGRSLAPQQTGSPAPGQTRAIPATIPESEDLLGDADPAISSKLTNETSELGNLSNQVGSLSKQMTELQGNRAQAEQEVSQTNQQKRAFEGRLAQLRSAYEKEVREFKALQEQLTVSRADTKRLQQDIAMVEGSHADLVTQHQQIRTQFEADQRENAALKEKIRQLNIENDQLKPQIDKLKGEARQQKGLVAINKKQLATNEVERDRLRTELEAAQRDIDAAKRELEESNRSLELSEADLKKTREAPPPTFVAPAVSAVKSPPAMPSPAASVTSNPFMRRAGASTSDVTFSPPTGSPEPTQDTKNAFDNIFGPSFAAGTPAAAAPTTSFRTATPTISSTDSTGISTPQTAELPAPPSAGQITSDSLPFRAPLDRAESIGSSVKVALPASRLSPADTPRALTPAASSSGDDGKATREDPFGRAAPDEEQDSVRQAVEVTTPANIPGAFPNPDTPRSATPAGDSSKVAAGALGIAAVAAVGAGASAATTHSAEDQVTSSDKSNNFDEYFGGPVHQRTPSEQVKDFDSAFASMGKANVAENHSKTTNQEFPDIQEMDDDDSSSDEEAPLGFEDDFNAKPANSAGIEGVNISQPGASSVAAGKQPEIESSVPSHLQARPTFETASSTASSLPGFEQQISPPTYNDSVPGDDPSHFPKEYKGLLPERVDPTSPPPVAAGSSDLAAASTGAPLAYGPEVARSQDEALKNVAHQAAQSEPPKATGFDFDSAFAGMGPAQVEDDDSDDADAPFSSNRNAAADFDPTFDSAVQSRATTVASTANSPAVHKAVTNGTSTIANGSATADFYGISTSTANTETSNQKSTSQSASHDWDSLFAPLNDSNIVKPTAQNDTSPTSVQPAGAGADAPGSQATLKPDRPQPGRALSTGTEHDDPILKRLTSMGWSRADSLAALEKFDYNIDKAADYLTFRS